MGYPCWKQLLVHSQFKNLKMGHLSTNIFTDSIFNDFFSHQYTKHTNQPPISEGFAKPNINVETAYLSVKALDIFSEYCVFITVLMSKLRYAAQFCVFSTTIFIYFVYAIAQPSTAPLPACKCVRHYLRTHNCDTHGRDRQTGATCSLILVTRENWAHLLWQFGLGKLLNIAFIHIWEIINISPQTVSWEISVEWVSLDSILLKHR